MATVYGVTSTGFVVKPFDAIKASQASYLRDPSRFGAGFELESSTPEGQLVDVFSYELQEVWAVMAVLYVLLSPAQAEGVALDNIISGLFNFPRRVASPTTATVTITGTASTVIPAGSQVSNVTTGDLYATTAEVTIGGGGTVSATVSEVNYETRTVVPTALADSLTVIESVLSGWTAVTNAVDGVVGTLDETDTAYYTRFIASRASLATCTAAATAALVFAVDDVNQVIVRENLTTTTDGLGQPGKSFWVVVDVDDNTDTTQRQSIAAIILNNKPAGIQSYGATAVTVTGASSYIEDPTVYLSYATETDIYIDVLNVVLDGDEDSDWATQVSTALLAYGATLTIGDDVVYGQLCRAVYGVTGIIGADITVGTSASPAGVVNVTITTPAIAEFDSSRITVSE